VVVGTAAADGDDDALLILAGAAEAPSEHPLARAIVAAARQRNGGIPAGEDFRALPGRGVDGTTVSVGGPALLRELSVQPPPQLDGAVDAWRAHVVRRCCTSSATVRSPERSPSRTRFAASRARRSTPCTGAACAW
jgi:cation transport ATPase